MVQGDEPVITSSDIKNIVAHFKNPEISVVNLMSPIISKNVFLDKNNVKVVVNTDFRAMYFSRNLSHLLGRALILINIYKQE